MGERKNGDLYEMLLQSEFIDITNGLPFASAQQLYEYIYKSFEKMQLSRFPILGVKGDEDKTRTFMLLHDRDKGHATHAALNTKLGNPIEKGTMVFATGLEGFTGVQPSIGIRLKDVYAPEFPDMKSDAFIPLIRQSDFVRIPKSDFNSLGQEEIKRIFAIPGIEFIGF